jgi:hypothetical protein
MKPTVHTFELMYRLAITFTMVALLGCGSGSNSAGNEPTDRPATITFQLKFNQSLNHALKIPVTHAIGEPDICNDYLIDTIEVQVYRTQDDTEVASAQEACTAHSLTITNVPAGESLSVMCKGYIAGASAWQGRMDGIVAEAGQNTDIGVIDMQYIGNDSTAPEIVSTFPAADAANNANGLVVWKSGSNYIYLSCP